MFEDIDFWFFAMLLTLAQLTFMFSDTSDLPPPLKGVNQGLTPLENRFLENCGYIFVDIDLKIVFWRIVFEDINF